MEFWGVEVKAGETLKVKPESDSVIHLSQAALGESKKDKANENIVLYVKIGDKKLVMGTLSSDKFPQLSFDVVFEKEFELSHNWKSGSLYLCGYQSPMPVDDENDLYESSDEEDEIPIMNANNGKPEAKDVARKSDPKPKAKSAEAVVASQDSKAHVDDDDEESDDEEDDSGDGAEDMSEDDEDDEDDSEKEETPKKAEVGKKRGNASAAKVPEGKKAKILTPQKSGTDGKKGNAHTATPYPAKKPAAGANKPTPKSGGQFSCKSCDRSFTSDNALQSHAKAKHT